MRALWWRFCVWLARRRGELPLAYALVARHYGRQGVHKYLSREKWWQ